VTMVFAAAGARSQSASANTITPTLPTITGRQLGAYIWVVSVKSNDVIMTAQPGWTKLAQDNSGAGFTSAYFIAPTTATAGQASWTTAVACSTQVIYVEDPDNPMVTNAIGATLVTTGTASPHTSTALTTTRQLSLVLAIDTAAANTVLTTPTGWTGASDSGSATDAGRTSFITQFMPTLGGATTAISTPGAAAAWALRLIELLIVLPATGIQVSESEVATLTASSVGISVAESEAANVMQSRTGVAVAESEIVLILAPGAYVFRRRRSLVLNGGQSNA
jgi:hypothetical protein